MDPNCVIMSLYRKEASAFFYDFFEVDRINGFVPPKEAIKVYGKEAESQKEYQLRQNARASPGECLSG